MGYTYIYICIHIYTYIYIYIHMYIYIHAYIHYITLHYVTLHYITLHTYIHYIHTHIYIYTHTPNNMRCVCPIMGCGPSHFHSLWIRWFPRLKVQKEIIQSSTGGFFGVPEPFGHNHGDQNLGLILEKKGKSVLYWSWLNTPGLPKINGYQSNSSRKIEFPTC